MGCKLTVHPDKDTKAVKNAPDIRPAFLEGKIASRSIFGHIVQNPGEKVLDFHDEFATIAEDQRIFVRFAHKTRSCFG